MENGEMYDKLVSMGLNPIYAGMKNGLVIRILNVINNKKSNPENYFVAEGIWLNGQVDMYNSPIRAIFICPEMLESEQAIALTLRLAQKADSVCIISEKVCLRLSDGKRDDAILSLCTLPDWNLDELVLPETSLIMVLDGLEIPGNVGTIIRSCDGAGVDAIFICHRRTRLTHPKVVRASMCTLLNKPVFEVDHEKLSEWLLKNNYEIWMADTKGALKYDIAPFPQKTALIMGAEKYGINKDWYSVPHKAVYIPMFGDVDSLNVGVAASILAYEAKRRQGS